MTYLTMFGDVHITVRILTAFATVVSTSIILLLGATTARVSTAFHRNYPLLNSIYCLYNGNDQIKLKVC